METKKICFICGNGLAIYVCVQCGKPVCNKCFNKEAMICISCKTGKVLR